VAARNNHLSGTLASRNDSGFTTKVAVWEEIASRRQEIQALVQQCGIEPTWIRDAAAIARLGSSGRGLAIVALTQPADARDSEIVGLFKQTDFKILCYADGAQSWPLQARCQSLLAGASRLLDSVEPSFSSELRLWLMQQIEAEMVRSEQEVQLKSLMVKLGIVGTSAALLSVFRRLVRVSALSDLPVLLTGETGTGKELFARALYRLDPKRSSGPFVTLNCGALSSGLVESELFGHRRGSFTGAERSRKGLIRSADLGVLLLDEIGELDNASQAKLLRVLQEHRVLSVGEDEEIAVSVRIIAATNRQLEGMVERGSFREDLFHRLNVVSIYIPPLRERPEDIQPLVKHFLWKYRGMTSKELSVQEDFLTALTGLNLPGNVRQLENLVRQALVSKTDEVPLGLSDLPPAVWRTLAEGMAVPCPTAKAMTASFAAPVAEKPDVRSDMMKLMAEQGSSLSRSLEYCEKMLLEAALIRARGNQSQAARLLGITPRSVYNKLRKHHLAA
jgi:transcriptional regulator with PAS, ATPase and Fis domain